MEVLLEELVRQCKSGQRAALCVVVGTRGSTPQERGAKMLVTASGATVGTLGGGCVEAEVRKRALELLTGEGATLMEFQLDHDYGWDDGLICGGVMDIVVQVVHGELQHQYEAMLLDLRGGRGASLRILYQHAAGQHEYVEEIGLGPKLVIAGAGHVAQALARIAGLLEFRITVIDDRADFASPERFPAARERIVGDIEAELRKVAIDDNTYVVILTRGHHRDGAALAAVVESPAKYVGLIGSKRKVKGIFDELASRGVSIERLQRVHAPVGYDIGAVSVPEIAVSIAAELIAVRRGMSGSAKPMRFERDEMLKWLSRDKS
ncbi:MAG: XdhC family protein [Tepidisphaeraceae bacterium]